MMHLPSPVRMVNLVPILQMELVRHWNLLSPPRKRKRGTFMSLT